MLGLSVTALLVGATYVPGLPSQAAVGRWWVAAIGALLVLWSRRVRPGRAHWLWLALLVWSGLSAALWAVSGWDALGGVLQLGTAALVFVAAAEHTLDEIREAWGWFAVGVALSLPFALAGWLGYPVVWSLSPGAGLLLSQNVAGEAAALALIGALALRCWALSAALLALVALAGGRMPAAALAAAGCAALWWRGDARQRAALVVCVLAAAATALAVFHAGHLGFFYDRWAIWTRYAANVNPWGDGLGAAAVAVAGFEFAHNEFIQFAFELGVGSILLWGIFWHALAPHDDRLAIPERAALVAVLAQCVFWFPLHDPATVFVWAMLAGGLAGARRDVRVAQCACGVARESCLQHHELGVPDGSGSIPAAPARRAHVAARPEHPVVAGAV